MRIPGDFPLSNGKITCITCHDIHGQGKSSFGALTYLLRRTVAGEEFCLTCHEAKRFAGSHAGVLAVAHMGSKFASAADSGSLDPLSVQCLSCHDGEIGRTIPCRIKDGVCNRGSGAHPVGMAYNQSRRRDAKLVPAYMLDKRLHLFDGRVSCGTCHDPYSRRPNKLVKSNEKSRLCGSCHKK